MPKATPIEATLGINIVHRIGPVIEDPNHVRRWLTADNLSIDGGFGTFSFDVCPDCPQHDECECDGGGFSTYDVTIAFADWTD